MPRVSLESFSAVDRVYPAGFQGPRELAVGEWVIQLSDSAASRVHALQTADELLDNGSNNFSIIAGLGSPGLLLMRGESVEVADVEQWLSAHDSVDHFDINAVVSGQWTPDDPDFQAGLLPGLDIIDVPTATSHC